jgi:hypothetical protein
MKSAIEEVSDQFEKAKRTYYKMVESPAGLSNDQILIAKTEFQVWGSALQILQDRRGNFIG